MNTCRNTPPKCYEPIALKKATYFSDRVIGDLLVCCGFSFDFDLKSELETILSIYFSSDRFSHLRMTSKERTRRLLRLQKNPSLIDEYPNHLTASEKLSVETGDFSAKKHRLDRFQTLTHQLINLYEQGTGKLFHVDLDGFWHLLVHVRLAMKRSNDSDAVRKHIDFAKRVYRSPAINTQVAGSYHYA